MRTVTFQSVLYGVARLSGVSDPANTLSNDQRADFADSLNDRVREGWERDWFHEWMEIEERFYRAPYSAGTAYTAPTSSSASEVWFPASLKYYQALRATTGNAPATLVDDEYEVNGAYWAECEDSYSGDDWETGEVYAVEDVVRNPDDNRYYACHTAHTAGATFDSTKFGILTPFNRYIAWEQSGQTEIGDVKQVTQRDSRVFPCNPGIVDHDTSDLGVQVGCRAPNIVWVEFRLRPPVFTTTAYSNSTTYAVGDLAYYSTTGECYKRLVAGSGNLPTDTTKWVKVDFPAILNHFVRHAVASDYLTGTKQNSRAARLQDQAYQYLANAMDTDNQQAAREPVAVCGRR